MKSNLRDFLTVRDGYSILGFSSPIISLNPYKSCDYGCLYCKQCKQKGNSTIAKEELLEKLEKGLEGKLRAGKLKGAFRSKAWLFIGDHVECFGPSEEQHKLSLEAMKILNKYNYRYGIITKSNLIGTDRYIEQLRKDTEIQISVSTPMDYCSRIMEQGAPTTSQRLKVAGIIKNLGYNVIVRVEPVFPDRPDYFYSLGRNQSTASKFVYWNNILIYQIFDRGIRDIIVNMLQAHRSMFPDIEKAFGFDLRPFYKENNTLPYCSTYYSCLEKQYYYHQIESLAKHYKIQATILRNMNER
jgi:DNA repair photolyase